MSRAETESFTRIPAGYPLHDTGAGKRRLVLLAVCAWLIDHPAAQDAAGFPPDRAWLELLTATDADCGYSWATGSIGPAYAAARSWLDSTLPSRSNVPALVAGSALKTVWLRAPGWRLLAGQPHFAAAINARLDYLAARLPLTDSQRFAGYCLQFPHACIELAAGQPAPATSPHERAMRAIAGRIITEAAALPPLPPLLPWARLRGILTWRRLARAADSRQAVVGQESA